MYHARNFPSAETFNAEIVSRIIYFELILSHVCVFQVRMLPPLSIYNNKIHVSVK